MPRATMLPRSARGGESPKLRVRKPIAVVRLVMATGPMLIRIASTTASREARPAFRCWARLMHRRSDTLIEDAMIAAVAEVHGLMVVTRNLRDFEVFGVATIDPFRG